MMNETMTLLCVIAGIFGIATGAVLIDLVYSIVGFAVGAILVFVVYGAVAEAKHRSNGPSL